MTCQHTISLGAYVLGALDPGDRVTLEQHLGSCPSCRDELVRFAPLPGLLSHLAEEDLVEAEAAPAQGRRTTGASWSPPPEGPPAQCGSAEGGGSRPPGRPDLGGPPTVGSRRLARRLRKRTRRRIVLAAAGAVLLAITAFGGMLGQRMLENTPAPVAAPVTWSATDPATGVKANAQLTPQAWGTEVKLQMQNLPANQRCQLVVHAKDGSVETAGYWRNDLPGNEQVPGASSMPVERIDHMDVVNTSNNVLVRLDPRR